MRFPRGGTWSGQSRRRRVVEFDRSVQMIRSNAHGLNRPAGPKRDVGLTPALESGEGGRGVQSKALLASGLAARPPALEPRAPPAANNRIDLERRQTDTVSRGTSESLSLPRGSLCEPPRGPRGQPREVVEAVEGVETGIRKLVDKQLDQRVVIESAKVFALAGFGIWCHRFRHREQRLIVVLARPVWISPIDRTSCGFESGSARPWDAAHGSERQAA